MSEQAPNEAGNKGGSVTEVLPEPHDGPICKGCGLEFYYDYIPERHDYSGYCWICFDDVRKNPMNFDLEDTRRDLIAMRTRLGADTPVGHRCSNIIAQMEALKTADSAEQRKAIKDGMRKQIVQLAGLSGGTQ